MPLLVEGGGIESILTLSFHEGWLLKHSLAPPSPLPCFLSHHVVSAHNCSPPPCTIIWSCPKPSPEADVGSCFSYSLQNHKPKKLLSLYITQLQIFLYNNTKYTETVGLLPGSVKFNRIHAGGSNTLCNYLDIGAEALGTEKKGKTAFEIWVDFNQEVASSHPGWEGPNEGNLLSQICSPREYKKVQSIVIWCQRFLVKCYKIIP